MRIALFTTSFPSNNETVVNAGVCVKDFAEALTDLGHEVEVLTPYKRGARHEFRHANTTWFRWLGSQNSLSHIGNGPTGLLQLGSVVVMGSVEAIRLLTRFRPDHVLCFWVFPCGFWARVAQPGSVHRTRYGRSARIFGYWVNCRVFGGFCAGSDVTPVIVTRTGCCSERSSKPSWVRELTSSPPRACSWHPVE